MVAMDIEQQQGLANTMLNSYELLLQSLSQYLTKKGIVAHKDIFNNLMNQNNPTGPPNAENLLAIV